MNKKMKLMLVLTGLLSTYGYASCNKQEVMKLIDKGFSKTEINSICDIQAKSTAVSKPKVEWIDPSNSTCQRKKGRSNKGICEARWNSAKNICRASGGRLPTLDELTQVVQACGVVVADWETDSKSWVKKKSKENMENSNYQRCYKQNGFSPLVYWSSLSDNIPLGRRARTIDFKHGSAASYYQTSGGYVRCVRDRQ